jgi:hypothetical protein
MSEEAEVPAIAERAASNPGSIYSDLAARVAATGREVRLAQGSEGPRLVAATAAAAA